VELAGLGRSVAIGGNAVAAGAPFYQGRTYTGAISLFMPVSTRDRKTGKAMTETFAGLVRLRAFGTKKLICSTSSGEPTNLC
jgi:hypothetical protein